MGEVQVKVIPPYIYFRCPISLGHLSTQVSLFCSYNNKHSSFEVPFGISQLINLKKVYPQARIVEGQEHIDKLKIDMMKLKEAKERFDKIKVTKIDPLDFDISFSTDKKPRKHQLLGLKYLEYFEGAALFADCGTGKTGMTLWDIEHKYRRNLIKPSSVLVMGKLMTLHTGWYEDVVEFTPHRSCVLWLPDSKNEYETVESIVVEDYGPKPEVKGKSKNYEKKEIYNQSDKRVILKSSRDFKEGEHIYKIRKWRELEGHKYGQETLTTVRIVNIRSKNIGEKILSDTSDIHIINHEGSNLFHKELELRGYEYIAVDESTCIKNPESQIFQNLLNISKKSKYRRVLSGTPSPQGSQDLWSQFYFLDGGLTLGPSYDEFLHKNFKKITYEVESKIANRRPKQLHKYVNRKDGDQGLPGTTKVMESLLHNRIFTVKLRDCIDLPEAKDKIVYSYLSGELETHYNQMKEALFIELENSIIEVSVALAKIGKLRQICSGFIIDKAGEVVSLTKNNPKMNILKSIIEEIGEEEKVVIFAVFRNEIEMLISYFGPKKCRAIYGGVSSESKIQAQRDFVSNKDITYLICQPGSAAYGVNKLTVARHMVFFSVDFRFDFDYQARKRIERDGQTQNIFFWYMLTKGKICEAIYKNVIAKGKDQNVILDIGSVKNLLKFQGV